MIITIREASDGKHEYPRFELRSDDIRIGQYGANTDELFETMKCIEFIAKRLGETCEFKIID